MTASDPRPTRRAVLLAAAVAVTGCTTARSRRPQPSAPDGEALVAAWHTEQQLLAAYPATAAEHATHLAHLHALESRLHSTPAPTPSPSASAAAGPRDEGATVPGLQTAARSADDGATAAVLASIAASHAVLAGRHR